MSDELVCKLAEALREEAEGAVLELRSVLDVMRAELDEVYDDAEGVSLVAHSREEISRLLPELSAVRTEQDEVVDSVVAAREEAFRFSTKLAEASRAHSTDSNISGETSCVKLQAMRGEVSMLKEWSKEARAELAWLWMELETSQADLECLYVASSHGGDALSLGSVSASTRALVIAEYLRSDV
ncbi:hypothetical protein ACLOJK_028240 [Asimina triloba]